MKKILVAIFAVILITSPALALNGGGKKKTRKKANVECKPDKTCNLKTCDPKNCDPRCCDFKDACLKDEKCAVATNCTGSK